MRKISNEGRYEATVIFADVRQSENTGKFFVSLGFKTDDGECIYTRLYLTDKAIEHSVKKLRDAFDFDGDFGNIESCVLDKRCRIVVAERESGNGKTFLDVKYINRIGSNSSVEPSEISRLSDEARKVISSENSPF